MNNVYVSKNAHPPLLEFLRSCGFTLQLVTGKGSPVYDAVRTHADIYLCQLGLWENARIFHGDPALLGSRYPHTVRCNAVCTGKYFIHNLNHTDPSLLQAAKAHVEAAYHHAPFPGQALRLINVRQGYARCTCLPVDDASFITSDEGITKALQKCGASVLLIRQGHIELPGFDYGFIGGCAGNLLIHGRRTIVFNGDLSAHPDSAAILQFIRARDIDVIWFDEQPLSDIGSILVGPSE